MKKLKSQLSWLNSEIEWLGALTYHSLSTHYD